MKKKLILMSMMMLLLIPTFVVKADSFTGYVSNGRYQALYNPYDPGTVWHSTIAYPNSNNWQYYSYAYHYSNNWSWKRHQTEGWNSVRDNFNQPWSDFDRNGHQHGAQIYLAG